MKRLAVLGHPVAQPALDVTTTPARPDTTIARPDAGTVGPTGPPHPVPGPYVPYAPFFIGPTVKTRTGEHGLSVWLAPNTPLDRTSGNEVSGWAGFGFTSTWGGPPYRLPNPPAN